MSTLQIKVNEKGAELASIQLNGREYLWWGDAAYWNRQAPILFPNVGKVFDNTFRVNGKAYHMGQHGFARDVPDGRAKALLRVGSPERGHPAHALPDWCASGASAAGLQGR